VIQVITSWPEYAKYFPAIVQWVGFPSTDLVVQHAERHEGSSSYTFSKLLRLGMDVVIGFSDKPLRLVMAGGFVIALLSFCLSAGLIAAHVLGAISVEGWASIVLSVWFLAGCILCSLGLTGLYIGRILIETKGRPSFIVSEAISAAVQGNRLNVNSSGNET